MDCTYQSCSLLWMKQRRCGKPGQASVTATRWNYCLYLNNFCNFYLFFEDFLTGALLIFCQNSNILSRNCDHEGVTTWSLHLLNFSPLPGLSLSGWVSRILEMSKVTFVTNPPRNWFGSIHFYHQTRITQPTSKMFYRSFYFTFSIQVFTIFGWNYTMHWSRSCKVKQVCYGQLNCANLTCQLASLKTN